MFANSPFTTTDSAIIKSSRPVAFWKKGVLTNFAKFTRNPMDTPSSIRHRFDVEIPRGKFLEVTSILKGESTWKIWHRFDVDISTWIRLSKSTKYRWVLHVDFFMLFRRQIDVTSALTVSILSFSNIFWSGNLFWIILIKCWVAAISMILT